MNPLSIFSNSWLTKLASVFGRTKIKTKILNSTLTTNQVVADLQYNNLEIGEWFELELQLNLNPTSTVTNNTMEIEVKNGSVLIGRPYLRRNDSGNSGAILSYVYTFKAQESTLYPEITIATGTMQLKGDGTKRNTFATLKKIENVIETNDYA